MIFVAVGASNCGKSYLIKNYILPTLLTAPSSMSDMAPIQFQFCLVVDPRSRKWPNGQYPGNRYYDANSWKRATTRTRVSCFENAEIPALTTLAWDLKDSILVLDELDECWYNKRHATKAELRYINRGRQEGCALVGTIKRLHGVWTDLRAQIQTYYFGGLDSPDDRAYAAKTVGVREKVLHHIPPKVFLEYRREHNERLLTTIQSGRRVILDRL
jgi:hypothetical protein